MEKKIINAYTKIKDEKLAIADLSEKLCSSDAVFTILFISNSYNLDVLGPEIKKAFGDKVAACTTAGEICCGYVENTITGVSFLGRSFAIDPVLIEDLSSIERLESTIDDVQAIKHSHYQKTPQGKSFSMLLIDGMSIREEMVTSSLTRIIEGIPLIGGSAGDGLNFHSTYIYFDGRFHKNSAILVLVTTTEKFKIFKHQHFKSSDDKFVITSSDPETRVVHEIDGYPAAIFYANRLNLDISNLTSEVFSNNPVILSIGADNYVRSIQKVNKDNSLTFYCAIENGLVLSFAKKESIIESLEYNFNDLKNEMGDLNLCILFECILRKLEVSTSNKETQLKINDLLKLNNAVGFHTYGEQFGGIHINQTVTGVAFAK